MKFGNWFNIKEHCEHYVGDGDQLCGAKVTHAMFLNIPEDEDYVIGTCTKHKGVLSVPLTQFTRKLDALVASGLTDKNHDLEWGVYEEIELPLRKKVGC